MCNGFFGWLPFGGGRKKKGSKQGRGWLWRKGVEVNEPAQKGIRYRSQEVSFLFLMTAMIFFAGQVILASLAALEFVFPNFRMPVPFNLGRSVHVNLSMYWPLMGIMGGIYYILPEETGNELYTPALAQLQYLWMTGTLLTLFGTLSLGWTSGREYLEGIFPIKVLLLVNLAFFAYIVLRTMMERKTTEWHPTMVGLLLGLALALAMFVPSIFSYNNIVLDEFFKFWTVHIWVESSLELVIAAVIASLLLLLTGVERKKVERWYYVEVLLVIMTGFLGVGHHYFWIGVSKIWQTIGAIFGAMQVIPVLFLALVGVKVLKSKDRFTGDKLVVKFVGATVFWNIIGAGGIGFLMTFPQTNKYLHGTEMVDAHAHLALFGTYGFLVIALAYYILPQWERMKHLSMAKGHIAFWLLNIGLAFIGGSLIISGILQAYLWRYVGLDFVQVREIIRPYMIGRSVGGAIFAMGGLIIGWDVVTNLLWQRTIPRMQEEGRC